MVAPERVPTLHVKGGVPPATRSVPLRVMVTREPAWKFNPAMERADDVPWASVPGVTVSVQALTVDDTVATWPADASVATAVLVPAVTPEVKVGMTNWQTKAPAAVVVIVVPANVQVALVLPLGVIATPSKVSVTLVEAAKPAPRAVAVDPMRPLAGPTIRVHAVTVVDDDAVCAG
jgi:hypothetical protein